MTTDVNKAIFLLTAFLAGCVEKESAVGFDKFAASNGYFVGEVINEMNVVVELCIGNKGSINYCYKEKEFDLENFAKFTNEAIPAPIVVTFLDGNWQNENVQRSASLLSKKLHCKQGIDCYLELR